jgi:hypothetical protein
MYRLLQRQCSRRGTEGNIRNNPWPPDLYVPSSQGKKTIGIYSLSLDVARPPEGVTPKGIIVHIHDAFGWQFINNRLLSDSYAERGGYIVYMPDFMNGLST